jgi:hypothetical protein
MAVNYKRLHDLKHSSIHVKNFPIHRHSTTATIHVPSHFHIKKKFSKKNKSLQRSCKDWFVIVASETGKHPENKEKNQSKK